VLPAYAGALRAGRLCVLRGKTLKVPSKKGESPVTSWALTHGLRCEKMLVMGKMTNVGTSYLLVILIYACAIPLLIVLLGPRLDRLLGLGPLLPFPYQIAPGIISLAYAWFWIAWSQVFIITRGKGHPNEILGYELGPLTQRLVTEGPYRYTRNPMAYGLLIFYFVALAFLRNSIITLALFPFACLFEIWYHTTFEEPGLLKRFGSEYERYRKEVPILLPLLRVVRHSR